MILLLMHDIHLEHVPWISSINILTDEMYFVEY